MKISGWTLWEYHICKSVDYFSPASAGIRLLLLLYPKGALTLDRVGHSPHHQQNPLSATAAFHERSWTKPAPVERLCAPKLVPRLRARARTHAHTLALWCLSLAATWGLKGILFFLTLPILILTSEENFCLPVVTQGEVRYGILLHPLQTLWHN